MKKLTLILFVALACLLAGCGTTSQVPITGRKHTLLVSDAQILSLSSEEYQKYMKSAKLSTNAQNTAMVERVGKRLASAVDSYLTQHGAAADVKNFAWEFHLVQDKSANAFCMPGGKIVVYEGLLPYTQNEDALAVVLGHEIAHAVAKHSAEQMSKQIRQQYGTQIGSAVLQAAGMGSNTTSILSSIVQQGFTFRNLKYSRDNESEADHMGLIFAAMAGYNPQAAIPFWKNMAMNSTSRTAEVLSDHPSDEHRIENITKLMPEALKYYHPAATPTTTTKATTTKKSTGTGTTKRATTGKKTTTRTKRR